MKYKIDKEENLYLIKDAYGEVVASCTNEKTAKYLLSLLSPANDDRSGLESPIAQKNKGIIRKEEIMNLSKISREHGVNPQTVYNRLKYQNKNLKDALYKLKTKSIKEAIDDYK